MKDLYYLNASRALAQQDTGPRFPHLFDPVQFELIFEQPPQRSVAEVVFAHSLLFLIAAVVCLSGLPL